MAGRSRQVLPGRSSAPLERVHELRPPADDQPCRRPGSEQEPLSAPPDERGGQLAGIVEPRSRAHHRADLDITHALIFSSRVGGEWLATLGAMSGAQPDPATEPGPQHLAATPFLDSRDRVVREFAQRAVADASSEQERVRRLFAAVRDEIRYDPYTVSNDAGDYVASAVLARGVSWCVPKAVVLTAASRSLGIPARLGFSDVRNHLQSLRLAELMGTDVFVYHGYTEMHVGGAWRKATPAFNATLCERFGVAPLEFDGTEDALLHPFTGDGSRHMEYVRDRGVYLDLPLEQILAEFAAAYPRPLRRPNEAEDPAFAE
jgi:transglutaminase-like putative cysteine protease